MEIRCNAPLPSRASPSVDAGLRQHHVKSWHIHSNPKPIRTPTTLVFHLPPTHSLKSCPNSQVSCPNSQDRNSAPTVRIPFTYYIRTNSSIHNTTATIPPTHPPSHPFFTELITASSTLDPTEQLLTLLSPNPAPTVRISLPNLPQQSGSPLEFSILPQQSGFQFPFTNRKRFISHKPQVVYLS